MEQLTAEERALVDELVECIAEAMARLDDVNTAYANKTKLQKLLYLAIDEFDLPITYSWYLAGAVVPGEATTSDTLQSAFDELPSTEAPEIRSSVDETPSEVGTPGSEFEETDHRMSDTETSDNGSVADIVSDIDTASDTESDDGVDPVLFNDSVWAEGGDDEADELSVSLADRRDEIIGFYESVIPTVWYQSTMRFLQNFYLEHAPAEYRDIYVQSTHLRTRLREVETAVQDHLDGKEPNQPISEITRAVGLDISDLHSTIKSSETLAATFDEVVRGTNLIEDGLMMLSQIPPTELTDDHLSAVQSMQEFFYYHVWRYPCLIISQRTVKGPSAEQVRTSRQTRLMRFETELRQQVDRFEETLADTGLLPDYTDYSPTEDEVEETITALADQYFD